MAVTRIKTVRLKNFLSFYEGTVEFVPGLTVIFGPNGAGKSAIVHAIKFALGSNQKENRYGKWGGFIRHGANTAEVEVVVQNNGTEITFKRKIDKDGVPRAYINGKRVPARELQRQVESLGFDVDNPLVFMPQERVIALKDANPIEVRKLIEEGTGLDKLRERILLQESRLKEDRVSLAQAVSEARAIENELRLLKSDMERLEKKREYQKQARILAFELKWATLADLEQTVSNLKKDVQEREAGYADLIEKANMLKNSIASKENELAALEKEIEKLQKQLGRIETGIVDEENRLTQLQDAAGDILREIRESKKKSQDDKGKLKQIRDHLHQLVTLKKQLLVEKQALIQDRDELDAEIDSLEKQLAKFEDWNRRRSKIETQLREIHDKKKTKSIWLSSYRNRLQKSEAELETIEARWRQSWEAFEKADEDELRKRKEVLDKKFDSLKTQKFQLESQKAHLEKEIEDLESKIKEIRKRVPESVNELQSAIKEHSLTEVKGPIFELVVGRQEFATATEAILANNMLFAFITPDHAEFQLLKRLRDEIEAPVPIIYVQKGNNPKPPYTPEERGVIGWLWRLLDLTIETTEFLEDLFGNYLVTKDERTAAKIAEKFQINTVSLSGKVFTSYHGGIISFPKQKTSAILSTAPLHKRLRKSQRELRRVKKKYTELVKEIDETIKERENLIDLIRQIDRWVESWQKRQELRQDIQKSKEEISRLKREIDHLQREEEAVVRKLRQLDNTQPTERSKIVGAQSAARMKLRRVERDLAKVEANLQEIAQNEAEKRIEQKHIKETINAVTTHIEDLKQELEKTKGKSTDLIEKIEGLKQKQEELESLNNQRKNEKDELQKILQDLRSKLTEIEFVLKTSKKEVRQIQTRINVLEMRKKDIENELAGSSKPANVRTLEIVQQEFTRIQTLLDEYKDVTETVAVTEKKLRKQMTELTKKIAELEQELLEAEKTIKSIKKQYHDELKDTLKRLEKSVNSILKSVRFEGKVRLDLARRDGDYGVSFSTRIKGSEFKSIRSGSGGEGTLLIIALILALQQENPAPVYALDEVDTFLDASNTEMVNRLFYDAARGSQFILFTPAKSKHLLKRADKRVAVVSPENKYPSVIIDEPEFDEDEETKN